MTYDKRVDGRGFEELREIEARAHVIERADGSAYFRTGNTVAYATVYGPRSLPRHLQSHTGAVLRCHYSMMPFSGKGDRVRPGPNRRAHEIEMVTENALLPVLDLSDYPNSVVDIYISLPQTDAGTRCAGIDAAAIALADAGIPMKDMVSAIAVGRVDDKVVVDLCYGEESYEGGPVSDIPFAMIHRDKEITLLQMDGQISKEMFAEAIEKAKKAMDKVYEAQKNALKATYLTEGDNNE
ncbi:MAG: exosome complex exonuclease Rrp41 [Nitrospiraceae bacterium]|nr:exosome complex exonuclease Rrp41 [Nitrospiraceae bacterium]